MARSLREMKQIANIFVAQARADKVILPCLDDLHTLETLQTSSEAIWKRLEARLAVQRSAQPLVAALFEGLLHPITVAALIKLADARLLRHLDDWTGSVRQLIQRHDHIYDVELTTAHALTEEDLHAVTKQLETRLHGTIHLRPRPDDRVHSGYVARCGDWRFDASLAGLTKRLTQVLMN